VVPDIVIHAAAAAAYAGLAWHFWRTRWRALPAGTPPPLPGTRPWERVALVAPLALHAHLLYSALFAPEGLRFGFAHALSTMVWLAVLFYWFESLFYDLDGMQAPALALATLAVPLPALFPGHASGTLAASLEFKLHLALAMLAYSLFTLAALHAMLMAVAERQLHSGRLTRPFANLPPLLTMEALLFRLIGIAFVLLTLTVTSGVVFSETLFGQAFRLDHKTVFAIISWLLFGALLIGRRVWGWRGRVALRWTLAGFSTLLLAYVGSRFVVEVVLERAS
jgi:ABC-type uncharacterized transport system permease subunit